MKAASRGKPVVAHRKTSGVAVSTPRPKSKSRRIVAAPLREATGARWTFLTNHSHVLILLSRNPSVVLREVALQVGITERAVQRIIADLESGGILERERVGRQNHYRIRTNRPLRHAVAWHHTIGELLDLINGA